MNSHTNLSVRSFAVSNAAQRKAGIAPCKGCQDRYPGCGADCDRYKAWKSRIADAKAGAEAFYRNGRDAEAFLIESYAKARKHRKGGGGRL